MVADPSLKAGDYHARRRASGATGCHGRNGEGSKYAPSLLTGDALTLKLKDVEYRIEHGKPLGPRGSMPAFRDLTKQQVEAIARYVISLRGAA